MGKKFVMLEHDADIKYNIFGKSLNDIFQNSAEAFSSYISSGEKINDNIKKNISLNAQDIQNLLYQFIDELIYLLDAEGFAVSKAKVEIENNSLKAVLFGDNVKNYHLNHVKAATYADMYIKELEKNVWEAQIVLDV